MVDGCVCLCLMRMLGVLSSIYGHFTKGRDFPVTQIQVGREVGGRCKMCPRCVNSNSENCFLHRNRKNPIELTWGHSHLSFYSFIL